MRTVIQISRTHVNAKGAWKPAWIPSAVGSRERDFPKASRLARLCKMVSSGFSERSCLEIQRWGVLQGDMWHQLWSSTHVHLYTYTHPCTVKHAYTQHTPTYMFKKETEMQWLIYRGISWLHITMNIWVVFFNDKSWQFKNASGSYTLKCNPYYFFKFLCYLLYCFWWRTGILFSVRISLELRWF